MMESLSSNQNILQLDSGQVKITHKNKMVLGTFFKNTRRLLYLILNFQQQFYGTYIGGRSQNSIEILVNFMES